MGKLKTIMAIIALMIWACIASIGATKEKTVGTDRQDTTITQTVQAKTDSFIDAAKQQIEENPGKLILNIYIILFFLLVIIHVILEKIAGNSDLFPEKDKKDSKNATKS